MNKPPLVLASTSPYRAAQLKQLGLDFEQISPECDEDSFKAKGLVPRELAETLAFEKAQSLKARFQAPTIIIGGDQLVNFQGEVLGKSGNEAGARAQLRRMSSSTHELISSICVIQGEKIHRHTEIAKMHMRPLSEEQIQWYLDTDKPFDCAGSYKLECSGIALFDRIECEDFSSITGVPLMALARILIGLGHPVP